jgi:hypothetical protein
MRRRRESIDPELAVVDWAEADGADGALADGDEWPTGARRPAPDPLDLLDAFAGYVEP